jgi:hypothetical protein
MRKAECRHYVANTVSCVCFPCTYSLLLLNCAICCPYNYYGYVCCKPTLLEKMVICLNWCRDTPPENRTELYCNYLSPCYCYDFPDPKQRNVTDFYFLPAEREQERKRFEDMFNLSVSIEVLKHKIVKESLKPTREQMS